MPLTKKQIIAVVVIIIIILLLLWAYHNNNKKKIIIQNPQNVQLDRPQPIILNESMTNLNPDNIQTPLTFYYFYNNKCPYCTGFNPTWSELVKRLAPYQNIITPVPIDIQKPDNHLVLYYNVKSTPTLILKTPNKVDEYNGNRNINDLYSYLMMYISPYLQK